MFRSLISSGPFQEFQVFPTWCSSIHRLNSLNTFSWMCMKNVQSLYFWRLCWMTEFGGPFSNHDFLTLMFLDLSWKHWKHYFAEHFPSLLKALAFEMCPSDSTKRGSISMGIAEALLQHYCSKSLMFLGKKNFPNFQTSTMLSSEKKTSSTWATVGMSVSSVSWSLVHLLSTRSSRVFQALRGKIGKATNGLWD